MKKHLLLLFAVSLLVLLAAAVSANYVLGCSGNLGPTSNHCVRAPDSIGSMLVGLMYVGAFGWLFTVPLAILAALLVKLFGRARHASK